MQKKQLFPLPWIGGWKGRSRSSLIWRQSWIVLLLKIPDLSSFSPFLTWYTVTGLVFPLNTPCCFFSISKGPKTWRKDRFLAIIYNNVWLSPLPLNLTFDATQKRSKCQKSDPILVLSMVLFNCCCHLSPQIYTFLQYIYFWILFPFWSTETGFISS